MVPQGGDLSRFGQQDCDCAVELPLVVQYTVRRDFIGSTNCVFRSVLKYISLDFSENRKIICLDFSQNSKNISLDFSENRQIICLDKIYYVYLWLNNSKL